MKFSEMPYSRVDFPAVIAQGKEIIQKASQAKSGEEQFELGQLRTERVDLRAEAFVFEYDHDFSSSLLVSMRKRRKVWYSAPFHFTC